MDTNKINASKITILGFDGYTRLINVWNQSSSELGRKDMLEMFVDSVLLHYANSVILHATRLEQRQAYSLVLAHRVCEQRKWLHFIHTQNGAAVSVGWCTEAKGTALTQWSLTVQ